MLLLPQIKVSGNIRILIFLPLKPFHQPFLLLLLDLLQSGRHRPLNALTSAHQPVTLPIHFVTAELRPAYARLALLVRTVQSICAPKLGAANVAHALLVT